DRHVNGKMCIVKSGKEAISKYKVIKEFKEYSLVEFSLLTGRTHQIRVHASYINHPLLGDVLYGGNMLYSSRVALHSYSISFNHPINKKPIDICINLPIDLDVLTK
ncbi:MAG: RluA family pseudouridine synthase, partial [Bacilli bacterium]|nr:RluA family pseudouridine synthase [Bacilli bacterium]